MKALIKVGLLLCFLQTYAQVGINTTDPEAQLDIKSSNQATPTNKDGILIPKVDAFPASNPTASQQGMLVYRRLHQEPMNLVFIIGITRLRVG